MVQSFIAPFIATFFIAMFVLIMQFLWTYIDDIIGKGAGFMMLVELLSYLSMSLIPTAFPIAILISSVMVLGNMAEHYELSSFKSAGVPLARVMAPLMILTIGISFSSYFVANNLIPITNLKFKSRLHDIRKQKPTLSLEGGVFNEDFKDFTIYIGAKDKKDSKTISDVLIYNHDYTNKDRTSIITAKKGEMYVTKDKQLFVMNLFNGTQYQETKPAKKDPKDKTYPFVRTSFKEWTKTFDLAQFEINSTDENLFKNHQTMLTTGQLRTAIDSLDSKLDRRLASLGTHFKKHFQLTKKEALEYERALYEEKNGKKKPKKVSDAERSRKDMMRQKVKIFNDSIDISSFKKEDPFAIEEPEDDSIKVAASKKKETVKKSKKSKITNGAGNKNRTASSNSKAIITKDKPKKIKAKVKLLDQIIDKPLNEYDSFIETVAVSERSRIFTKSKSFARSIRDQSNAAVRSINRTKETRVKHIYELNMKFSMAVVCFIFLFIGGPMGAIIRKGGFGYPILIAIIFFMIYMVMNIFCKKLAESFVLPALFASWVPCMILFPIGLILTYRAMNDSPAINFSWFGNIIDFFKRLLKREVAS